MKSHVHKATAPPLYSQARADSGRDDKPADGHAKAITCMAKESDEQLSQEHSTSCSS